MPNVTGFAFAHSPLARSVDNAAASPSARARSLWPRLLRDTPSFGTQTAQYSVPSGLRSYTRTRVPRRAPTVLDQHLREAIAALLASEEAAGEFVYVRTGSMRTGRLPGKIRRADAYPSS